MKNIILASQSPRRKQLLEQAEITFSVKTVHTREDYPSGLPAEEVPVFIATHKGAAVWDTLPDADRKTHVVIAADTVVILDNIVLGKPGDDQEALQMLKALSGKKHRVITAVACYTMLGVQTFSEVTEVYFRKLSEAQLIHYIKAYQPYDKAGAYAIQEWIGLVGIEKINGDFYNVMGLPVGRLLQVLAALPDDLL